jgi:hypothetical protein
MRLPFRTLAFALLLALVSAPFKLCSGGSTLYCALAQSPATAPTAPAQLTAAQDHQRLMDLLGIIALRPGVSQSAQSDHPVNWDESKANPWPSLPDPLLLANGKPVKTAKVWWTERRPQLVELFDREVFGRVPANVPAVHWEVVSTTSGSESGIAIVTKHLVGHVDNSAYPAIAVNIEADLILPADEPKPVPVVVEITFDHRLDPPAPPRTAPPTAAAVPTTTAATAPVPSGPSPKQQTLARGWAFAQLYPTSFQADNGAGLEQGIIGLANHGQPRKLDDWGALRAWAWGSSRLLDYFETDPDVDARHVAIEGHSRFGKTALVAMAYDSRFTVAYISSSGAGGADLARRHFGEQLENIAATGEYHWMDGNYLRYAELTPKEVTPADMPVDTHELIALCAPRPVFIGGGTTQGGDGWADVRGTFLAEAAAGPVYKLLDDRDLGATEFPPVGTALTSGSLAFRQHPYGHTPQPNFAVFLDFAGRYMTPGKTPPE